MASKRGRISLKPGNMKGLSQGKPALPRSRKPPKIVADALGLHSTTGASQAMLAKLMSHPNPKVVKAAKRLM